MIKNIIFDIGQVLLRYDPEGYMRDILHFDEETIRVVNEAMFQNRVWDETDRGIVPEETLMELFISHNPAYEKEIRIAHDRMGECLSLMPYAVDWVKSLKAAGYKLYILSNYGEHALGQTEEKMKFLPYMDGVVFSYRVQLIKPDPHIYRYILDRYHLNPEETVFLDDRRENVELARVCGLHGIVFTGFEEGQKELQELIEKER